MRLAVEPSHKEGPGISVGGHMFLASLHASIPAWQALRAECVATPWEELKGNGALGRSKGYQSTVRRNERDVLSQTLRDYGSYAVFAVEILEEIEGIAQKDSFASHAFVAPSMDVLGSLRALAVTYGLGDADDPFGGYWPTAVLCDSGSLPGGAFAPLVLWNANGALAVAPADNFLTSSMIAGGRTVVRGIHGSVDRLAAGHQIETLLVAGRDTTEALMRLGDLLLERGGKERPNPRSHVLTSTIGWWNAYGGYYTEPIHPLESEELQRVVDDIDQRKLPIGYLGLDLWYPYEQIGQGTEFAPDPAKYPDGVGSISARAKLPTVLHVSALAPSNAYRSDGRDGEIYGRIGEEIRRQGGRVVWHDWMRTQQHLTAALRSAPDTAETWYRKLTSRLADHKLDVLQCMQTMGMALASTAASNVRSARASIDYLFALPEAMDTLASLGLEGFRREAVAPIDLNRQNLLMGAVLYSLGQLPFHDLFLSRFHEGIGGSSPQMDAVLRALSCGPVGIGDAPGMADGNLLWKLIGADGRLLQPDRPPFPCAETLGRPVELYWTIRQAGDFSWIYVLLLNRSQEKQPYAFDPPLAGRYVVRDGISGRIAQQIAGRLQPGAIAYYVLNPSISGISPLGLIVKLVPAPAGRIDRLEEADAIEISIRQLEGRFAVHSDEPVDVAADGALLPVARDGSIHTFDVSPEHTVLRIRRR